MASSAKQFSLFLLITLLSSLHSHARDSQFFNKIPSTTNNNVVPNNKETSLNQQEQEQEQEPAFLPDNENSYGLYGHESGQLPPSATTTTTTVNGKPATTVYGVSATTTTATPYNTESKQPLPNSKYLPKNYNPTAYVTQPEDMKDSTTFTEEKSYTTNPNNNEAQNYYNSQKEEESEYRSYPTTTNTNSRNNNYRLGSSFNSQPQGLSDTRWGGATLTTRENYNNNGDGYQPQGMSDTRFLENGKYHYDVNNEKYSSNHPYESLRGVGARNEYNNRNYYGNSEINGYEFQNKDEFQEEDTNMP